MHGLRMDAEVAEKIFGYEVRWVVYWEYDYKSGYTPSSPDTDGAFPQMRRPTWGGWVPVPTYSSELGHAWKVIEHFREQGKALAVVNWPDGYEITNYDIDACPLRGWDWTDDDITIKDTFAPRAICRAGLALKGVRT